ncbi:serine phosphatase RsbU (regulator of sigma subunit) [Streptomyces sp. TLI_235]|nr:SpoIIE family protein phosphatase [Streptomyces sp. TLI_235]PBC70887.1 serine phosphatase RsbU (regulator of sigma subunit) [Streptomyces sp. TLI_235]
MRLGVPADGEPGAAVEDPDAPRDSDAPDRSPADTDHDPPPGDPPDRAPPTGATADTGAADPPAPADLPWTGSPGPPGPPVIEPPGALPGAADRDAIEKLLAEGLTRAVALTSGYGGLVYLPSSDHRSLVLSTVVGVPLPLLSAFRRIAVVAPLPPAEAYRTGRTIVLADPDETMRRFPRLAVGLPYAFSFAAAPIATRDGTLGVLCVLWPSTEAGLPGGARRQLRSSANRIAASLAPFDELVATDEPTVVQLPPPSGPATRVGVFDWDIPGRAIAVDEELEAILGLARGAFDGRLATLVERLSPEDMPLLREAARRAALDGRPFDRQVRVRDPRGGHRTLELRGRRVADGTHLVVVVLDDSAGSAAVAAVERLRDGVFALDAEGMVTYVNRTAEMYLQARRDELLGRHPWDVLSWLGDPAYEDRYRAAMLSRRPTAFLACRPPDHWLAFSLYPDAHGVTGRVVAAEPADPRTAALPEAPPAAPASLGATYHLLQLASALTEAVSVQEVCATVLEQILPGYGGQELALYLAQNGRMHLVAQSGYPEGFLDRFEATPLGARLPGTETLIAGSPLFFQSSRELLSAYPGIPQDEMRAWAFLPLIASGHPIGSLILGFDQPRTFTPEDRVQLTALGGLIAQALERARLYDAEFELARGLQQALLPHRLPTVPGIAIAARYLPGTRGMEIGGDWYDVITTPHGLCLVIGDVEGHNVGAAATMGQLRSAVRAFASGGSPPAEVLVRTNHLMVDLDPGLLASCCLIHLDPTDGRAHGVRAGHPPPLLRRPDGRTDVVDLEGGPLLGVDRASHYPTTRLHLPVGSVLALYTDGLVETPSTAIDQGIDELRSSLAHAVPVVSSSEGGPVGAGRAGRPGTLDGLADALVSRARRTAQRLDDIALLLVRRE